MMTTTTTNLNEILLSRKYDRSKVPKQPHIAFTIQNKCIAQLGSYCVFSGLPKTAKSTFIAASIASAYLPKFQDNWGIKFNLAKDRKKIGYFDTESSEYDFYKQIDKIKQFTLQSTYLNENIDCFNTREDDPKMIRALITEYLENTPDCSILIIDGFLDLCFNYNDEIETRMLTNWFKKITKKYNIMLAGVLHLGKGGNDTLGHLGSNTDRWANSTLVTEKNKETKQFVLRPKFLRSAGDFDPIAIQCMEDQWHQVNYIENEIISPKKKK